ncbi:hypothetical protein D3C72_1702250 [compost metagenome]
MYFARYRPLGVTLRTWPWKLAYQRLPSASAARPETEGWPSMSNRATSLAASESLMSCPSRPLTSSIESRSLVTQTVPDRSSAIAWALGSANVASVSPVGDSLRTASSSSTQILPAASTTMSLGKVPAG